MAYFRCIGNTGGGGVAKTFLYSFNLSQGMQWLNTGVNVTNINTFMFERVDNSNVTIQALVDKADIAVYTGGQDVQTIVYTQDGKAMNTRIHNSILYVSFNGTGSANYITNVYAIQEYIKEIGLSWGDEVHNVQSARTITTSGSILTASLSSNENCAGVLSVPIVMPTGTTHLLLSQDLVGTSYTDNNYYATIFCSDNVVTTVTDKTSTYGNKELIQKTLSSGQSVTGLAEVIEAPSNGFYFNIQFGVSNMANVKLYAINIGGSRYDNSFITKKTHLNFTGTNYITLPLTLDSDYAMKVAFTTNSQEKQRAVVGNNANALYFHLTQFEYLWYAGNGVDGENTSNASMTGSHTYEANENGAYFDGVRIGDFTPTTYNNANIIIGGRPISYGKTLNDGSIERFTIKSISNGTTILDLVPAIMQLNSASSLIGMVDLVQGSFYPGGSSAT